MQIGKMKAGGVPLVTLAVAGISKPFLEGLIAGTSLGNGTLISGVGKVAGAMVARQFVGGNAIGNGIQVALAVDGIEDILQGVLRGNMFGAPRADNW